MIFENIPTNIVKTFKFTKPLYFIIFTLFNISCETKKEHLSVSSLEYHQAIEKINSILVYDIFSPPVASRVYAYSNIAAYEVIANNDVNYRSLSNFISLPKIPESTDNQVNIGVAALVAKLEVSKRLVFSEDKLLEYRDSLYYYWNKKNPKEFKSSKNYGIKVAGYIKDWLNEDNYNETRTQSRYIVDDNSLNRWQPTPPAYMDGIEPHWNKIRPFTLDSLKNFKPIPHPKFSLKKDSKFYKELIEVYELGGIKSEQNKNSEHIDIAMFWDCNPYVVNTKGHIMFATKKITPGGHWIGICKIACQKENYDLYKTVYAYTKTSIAIADAFISCWDEKYSSNLIRPETLINKTFDENWFPVLQTPPFPEYTSGHSVVSGAASVVLTNIFGDNFYFTDDTEVKYGLPIRKFNSFYHASSEAAISRLYGGIHYRAAIDNGLEQGKKIGYFVNTKLHLQN